MKRYYAPRRKQRMSNSDKEQLFLVAVGGLLTVLMFGAFCAVKVAAAANSYMY